MKIVLHWTQGFHTQLSPSFSGLVVNRIGDFSINSYLSCIVIESILCNFIGIITLSYTVNFIIPSSLIF